MSPIQNPECPLVGGCFDTVIDTFSVNSIVCIVLLTGMLSLLLVNGCAPCRISSLCVNVL